MTLAAKTAIADNFFAIRLHTTLSGIRQSRSEVSRGPDRGAIRKAKAAGEKRNLLQSCCGRKASVTTIDFA
jgi:hypothetical protein